MNTFFKRLFCKHEYSLVRGIYGDEIIEYGWKQSIVKCQKCGKTVYRNTLEGVD